jgi:hypothetical protein
LKGVVVLEFIDHDHSDGIFINFSYIGMILQGVHRKAGNVVKTQKSGFPFFCVELVLKKLYKLENTGAKIKVERVIGNGTQYMVKAGLVFSFELL